jgi:hypothetical protein
MRAMQESGSLREYVVIALGTNGDDNYSTSFTRIINALEPGHRLIFVTPFDGRENNNSRWTNETAEWMRNLPYEYDFITVADWNSIISSQVELLAPDKVHLGYQSSMNLYADMISEAISVASQKPAKS